MSNIIERSGSGYPAWLETIDTAPKKLYCIGDASLLETRCIAICGSRKCSPYGVAAAEKIAAMAAECGITIVSGMAAGIDSAAHRGALNAGGKTIAVLGCGVDICYPRQNIDLYRRIREHGLIISEYPDGAPPIAGQFPARNRIISGLSECVVVVEAANRSGALITAEKAMDQGRNVYVVPGNIFSAGCFGSNHLILDGAEAIVDLNYFFEKEIGVHATLHGNVRTELEGDEKEIYELVYKQGEVSIEKLYAATLLSPKMVNGILTVLELKGLVITSMGKVFISELNG